MMTLDKEKLLTLEECDQKMVDGFLLIEEAVLNYARHGLSGKAIARRIRAKGKQIGDSTLRRWLQNYREQGLLPERKLSEHPKAVASRRQRRRAANAQSEQMQPAPDSLPSLKDVFANMPPPPEGATEVGEWEPKHNAFDGMFLVDHLNRTEEQLSADAAALSDALGAAVAACRELVREFDMAAARGGPQYLQQLREATIRGGFSSNEVANDRGLIAEASKCLDKAMAYATCCDLKGGAIDV